MRGFQIKGAALAAAGFAAMTTMASAAGFGDDHSTTTSQTTTSTTKNGDTMTTTTTTHSETSSHGIGFGFGPGHGGDRPGFSYESLGGRWQIGEAKGDKVCDLTLDSTKFISNYGAHTGIGCPEGLFGVSSWTLTGDEIRLMSPGGSVLATLQPAGHGRWNGSTAAGLAIFMTRQ